MNKQEIIKNLLKDIQDLYSIANRLEHEEQIHRLDIDLALSKVRNLYDLLLTINPQAVYQPENQIKEIKKTEPEKETKPREPVKEKKPETIKETNKEPEFIIEKPENKQQPAEEPDKKTEPVKKEEIRKEKKDKKNQTEGAPIVADKFQSKKFVHDNITQNNSKKDVSSKMQSKPIHDISSAIGLNDKFIFIRELFNGDKEQFQETIQVLNNFDTYENAFDFLSENFDWDDEDPNFERLKELVKRKFATI